MNRASILVLSRYRDLFNVFRVMVDKLEPDMFKILVRDGKEIAAPKSERWLTFNGEQPFNFSRSFNLGVKEAEKDDILICGDDLRVFTPRFGSILREIAYSDPSIGVCVPELGGQSILVCGYIKREVLDKVGGLDERFDGYGMDDVDFYHRYELAGYKTWPTKRIVAEHTGGTSFYRREREAGISVQQSNDRMRELYEKKWAGK
jgi:hypothetical protein